MDRETIFRIIGYKPSKGRVTSDIISQLEKAEEHLESQKLDVDDIEDEISGAHDSLLINNISVFLAQGEKSALEAKLAESKDKIQRSSNSALFRLYALSCIYIGDLNSAYGAFSRIHKPDAKLKEVMGLLSYQRGKYARAVIHFTGIEKRSPLTMLADSLAVYHEGNKVSELHEQTLTPILETSVAANTFLGTIYYNEGNYKQAEEFFSKAAELSPNSAKARLNALRAKYANGKTTEVHANVSIFYIDTGSTISQEDMETELHKKQLDLPELRVKGNLFDTVVKLLE